MKRTHAFVSKNPDIPEALRTACGKSVSSRRLFRATSEMLR